MLQTSMHSFQLLYLFVTFATVVGDFLLSRLPHVVRGRFVPSRLEFREDCLENLLWWHVDQCDLPYRGLQLQLRSVVECWVDVLEAGDPSGVSRDRGWY